MNRLTGPEFLFAVADKERALGNDINADEYERRANEWQAERWALERLRAQAAEYQDRRAVVRTIVTELLEANA